MEYEFYHHGIIGQKWGVRRYQNEDGTYTQAGLRRYRKSEGKYNEADSKYKSVKSDFKNGKANESELNAAKKERRDAKRQMNRDYRQLARDKKADKGKELYANGQTITGNKTKAALADIGIGVLTAAGVAATAGMGIKFAKKFGNTSVAGVISVPGVILTTGIVASLANKIATDSKNSKLRAYYGHSRTKEE